MDVPAIRAAAVEDGWREDDASFLDRFWEAVTAFSEQDRRRFLLFATVSDRMPLRGWSAIQLVVRRNGSGDDRLPTAYTCFNTLLLPRFEGNKQTPWLAQLSFFSLAHIHSLSLTLTLPQSMNHSIPSTPTLSLFYEFELICDSFSCDYDTEVLRAFLAVNKNVEPRAIKRCCWAALERGENKDDCSTWKSKETNSVLKPGNVTNFQGYFQR